MPRRAIAFLTPLLARLGRSFPGVYRALARWLPPPAEVRLLQKITAYWTSQAISVAAELGIADRIGASEQSVSALAACLQLPADPLRRLLRALASEGILEERREGHYSLTPLGRLLIRERPGSLHGLAVTMGREWYRAWGELRHCVSTGETAFEKLYGESFFAHLQRHPELQEHFDEGMAGVSGMTDLPLALAYDFSHMRTLTDVGGGTGSQVAAILALHPQLNGIVFDLPEVAARGERALRAPGAVRQRIRFAGGDFTQRVPGPCDGYLLKSVLHDWNDDQAVAILRRCREPLRAGDRLLIAEHVLLPGRQPQFGKILDLMMLVNLGGRERTRAEYAGLLEKAGLRLIGEYPTLAEMTVLEAVAGGSASA